MKSMQSLPSEPQQLQPVVKKSAKRFLDGVKKMYENQVAWLLGPSMGRQKKKPILEIQIVEAGHINISTDGKSGHTFRKSQGQLEGLRTLSAEPRETGRKRSLRRDVCFWRCAHGRSAPRPLILSHIEFQQAKKGVVPKRLANKSVLRPCDARASLFDNQCKP